MGFIDLSAISLPPILRWLHWDAGVSSKEILPVFNCGIGVILAVSPDNVDTAKALIREQGVDVIMLGVVKAKREGSEAVEFNGCFSMSKTF